VNTAAQIVCLVAALLHAATGLPPREILLALAVLTLATTIASGAGYVGDFARRAWHAPLRRS
jgi:hypothetical protein